MHIYIIFFDSRIGQCRSNCDGVFLQSDFQERLEGRCFSIFKPRRFKLRRPYSRKCRYKFLGHIVWPVIAIFFFELSVNLGVLIVEEENQIVVNKLIYFAFRFAFLSFFHTLFRVLAYGYKYCWLLEEIIVPPRLHRLNLLRPIKAYGIWVKSFVKLIIDKWSIYALITFVHSVAIIRYILVPGSVTL